MKFCALTSAVAPRDVLKPEGPSRLDVNVSEKHDRFYCK